MGLKLQLTPAESQKKGGHVDKWAPAPAPAGALHHYSWGNSKPFDNQFDVGVDHCRYIYIYLFPIPIHPLPGDDQESVPGAAAGGRPGPGGEVATLFTLK